MKCPYCGAENDEKNKFCNNCGKELLQPQNDSDSLIKNADDEYIAGRQTMPVPEKKNSLLKIVIVLLIIVIIVACLIIVLLLRNGKGSKTDSVTTSSSSATEPQLEPDPQPEPNPEPDQEEEETVERYWRNPEPYQQDGSFFTYTMGGETYKNCQHDGDYSVTWYRLDGEYKTMTFTLGHIDGEGADGYKEGFKIYLDDKEIADYGIQGGELTEDMLPEQKTLDVSGGKVVKIEGYGIYGRYFAITDLVFDRGA